MRVLIINSVCGIRSTGRIVTEIAENYLSKGHDCRIAYGRENVPEKYLDISYKVGAEYDIVLNAINARIFDNEGFNAIKATKRFIVWAESYNPDILWLHNLHGYYINVEMLFDWIKSRPDMEIKWTFHDCWAFTGHCAHFSFVKCDQWQEGCEKCIQKNEYPKSVFLDNSKENFQRKKNAFTGVKNMTVITPSDWLARLVRKSFFKEYPVEVVYNKIDYEVFKPTYGNFRRKYSLENKYVILGVASAWSKRKGLYDYIKLSKLLDDSFKIVLVGLTSEQIKIIPKDIICIERTNSVNELVEMYTESDIFLNLTYEDTYPTVNLEAQACGTPCITYNTGGSVESVPENNVVEQGDLNGVVSKIKKLIENN